MSGTAPTALSSQSGIKSFFRVDFSTWRGKATAGLLFAIGLIVAWVVANATLPAKEPLGEIIQGLVVGALNSLAAMGLVLIYRAIRVINFAQMALGSMASALSILLVTGSHWSYWYAVPVGIAAAILVGFLVDLLIHWRFGNSPRLIVTVVTIGIAELVGFIALKLPNFFNSHLSPFATFKTPFTLTFHVAPLTFTGNDLMALVVVPVALAGLWWFLTKTDTGVAIRAAADSSERAILLGIPVRRLTRIAWMVAAGLSAVASILLAPINGVGIGTFQLAVQILLPLSAFVLAGMESLPLAVVWSLILGVVQQSVFANYNTQIYAYLVDFVLMLLALLFYRTRQARVTGTGLGEFVAVREVKAVPTALATLREFRIGRAVLIAMIGGLAIAVPWFTSAATVSAAVTTVIYAIIAVSMVILVGWAGQISLGQFAFAALGGCVAGSLMVHQHLPFLLTIVLAGFAGGLVAMAIGIPALRLEGMALSAVTLGFAVVMSTYFLSSTYFPWLDPANINAPVLFKRFTLSTPYTSLYEFGLVILAMAMVAAVKLTRSRTGRAVKAVRENSRAASAYGISPFRTKLLAFAMSGFIAGIAGVLYVIHEGGVASQAFSPTNSIFVFLAVIVGGLGSVTGAVIGAIYLTVVSTQLNTTWQLLGTGAGVLVVLIVFPEGLGSLLFRARDYLVLVLARAKGLMPTGTPKDPHKAAELAAKMAAEAAVVQANVSSDEDGRASKRAAGSRHAHTAALRLGALEDLELNAASPALGTGGVDAGPPGGRDAVMTIADLDAGYGGSRVLSDIGFGVAESEIVALLGTNGAGKTTTLRTIAGLLRPRRGSISFFGEDLTSRAPIERVKSGLVTVLGGRGVFPSLTVTENLRIARWTAHRHHKDPAFAKEATDRIFTLFPVLSERRGQRAGSLSGGEQQMLTLAQALLCRPRMLLVDELSLGLAPGVVADLLEVIRTLAAGGVTVIIVEQSVNVASAVSSRAIFVERGHVRFSGPTPSIDNQPELLRSVFLHAAERARKRKGIDAPTAAVTAFAPSAPVVTAFAPAPPDPPPGLEPAVPAIAATVTPPDGPSAFSVVGASKFYGGVAALSDVSIEVAPGEILGIIGSNGAGKTTFFDVCCGFTRPDLGHVTMGGVDITKLSPTVRARQGLGRVFQDARIWPSMSVAEAIETALEGFVPVRDPVAAILHLAEVERSEQAVADRARELMVELGLERFAERSVSDLSTGIRRIVELACALAHEPTVLLLDEPTSGISQRESEALGELLLGLRDETGAAFIVIEHDVPLVSSLADRLVCMHLGQVIASGETTDVLGDPVVVAAYLGAEIADATRGATPVGR